MAHGTTDEAADRRPARCVSLWTLPPRDVWLARVPTNGPCTPAGKGTGSSSGRRADRARSQGDEHGPVTPRLGRRRRSRGTTDHRRCPELERHPGTWVRKQHPDELSRPVATIHRVGPGPERSAHCRPNPCKWPRTWPNALNAMAISRRHCAPRQPPSPTSTRLRA